MTLKFKSGDFCFQLEGGMQLPLAVFSVRRKGEDGSC